MFGRGKNQPDGDKLSVQVYAVTGDEPFKLAQKLWDENARTVRIAASVGKEFLHFAYANPACVVWFQRDQGRTGTFELIVRWEADKTHEVFVLTPGQPAGNAERAKAVLNSMLTTPSVVLSNPS
jgi:hypothetical protein